MAQRRTDAQMRVRYAAMVAVGAVALLGGLVLLLLAETLQGRVVGVPLALLGALLILGALIRRRRYFRPDRVFLRELGGADGWLDHHDLAQTAGADALRPDRARGGDGEDLRAHGWRVGSLVSGARRVRGRAVFSPWARGFGIVGPQGSGKTQFLVNIILDSPGAAVIPSTKPELVELTRQLRERVGRTAVFNPSNIGTIGSDFQWDPLSGCADQQIADRRAWALVRGSGGAAGTDRADFWAGKAQEILRCYLMAAALESLDMERVMLWANDPDDPEPVAILDTWADRVPGGWLATLQTHLRASKPTRTGYFATVTSCVGFMDSPTVAAACRPPRGQGFDVAAFIGGRGTLYLVGAAGDRRLAPLLTALTEYTFDSAQRIAASSPGGRLRPTVNFILDEVANITPVPLDRWASDSRGWGITIGAVVQSLAQLATTWGREQAEIIWENLPTKIVLPGVTNMEDLKTLSFLAGERWVQRETVGETDSGRGRTSRSTSQTLTLEPVIAGYTISNMPMWHAYVLGLGRHPAIVSYEPGYLRVAREAGAVGTGPDIASDTAPIPLVSHR